MGTSHEHHWGFLSTGSVKISQRVWRALSPVSRSDHIQIETQLAHIGTEFHRFVETPLVVASDGECPVTHVVFDNPVQLSDFCISEQRYEAVAPSEHDDFAVTLERLVNDITGAIPIDLAIFGEDRGQ